MGVLVVYLDKATDLKGDEDTDAYVTFTLKQDGTDVDQQKSTIAENKKDPVWGEIYIFDNIANLPGYTLYYSCKNERSVLKDESLGKKEIFLDEVEGLKNNKTVRYSETLEDVDGGKIHLKLKFKD